MSNNKKDIMKSGSHEPTDWAILQHVSLYHFTFRQAVEKLFFPGDPAKAGTALNVLTRSGYLSNSLSLKMRSPEKTKQKRKEQPQSNSLRFGKTKYYLLGNRSRQLASKGFVFPKERLQPPSTDQSLYKHLAALWFCLFSDQRRYRLDLQELNELLSGVLQDGRKMPHQPAFCLADENDKQIVYRLYPTKKTKSQQIVNEVLKKLKEDADLRSLRPVIESGEYSYAIMVPSTDRIADVEQDLQVISTDEPLLQSASVIVRYAPSVSMLNHELRNLDSLQPAEKKHSKSNSADVDSATRHNENLSGKPKYEDFGDFGSGSIIV